MAIPRNLSSVIQRILDDWIPPAIRDARWFIYIPMKLIFKKNANVFLNFKGSAYSLSNEEFSGVYEAVEGIDLQGETDLNKACTKAILVALKGKNTLEVGCGRGYLAGKLSNLTATTACDIFLPNSIKKNYPEVKFVEGDIEKLPFKNRAFDTVVTTHTLEHVRDLPKAISELRRVATKRIIIVVPRQRPYTYNFSLHLNYFSHTWSFPALLGYRKRSKLEYLGDWIYIEDFA